MWQTRWARHRSACPPLSILGEIRSLPNYENIDFILGKQGVKVPSSHFCHLYHDMPGKQCIGAPRCACGHFTIPASNACVYTQAKTPFSLPSNIPNPLTRPHKLRIVRLAANGKAHSLRCSSFPRTTHFVGLALGPLSRLRTFRRLLVVTRKGTDGFFSVCAFGSYALVFVRHVFTVAL